MSDRGGEREDSSTEGKVKKKMGTHTYAADFESQTTCQQQSINQPSKQEQTSNNLSRGEGRERKEEQEMG